MEHNVSEKLHRINNLLAETDAVYHQASLRLGIADSTMRILESVVCSAMCTSSPASASRL